MKKLISVILVILLVSLLIFYQSKPQHVEGEDFFSTIVTNMVSGGPAKDGIPSIEDPKWMGVLEANEILKDDSVVYGYYVEGIAKAITQDVLYWHEIVNDNVNNKEFSVTYCPLTNTIIGYKNLNLGVSGNLYNSNLVLYDRATDSEIPQILQTAVNGPIKGERLENFYVYTTTWGQWKEKYPTTSVMTQDTGYKRDYGRNPYPGYEALLRVWFPVAAKSDLYTSKTLIHGVEHNGEFLAISKEEFKLNGNDNYDIGGDEINIIYETDLDVIKVYLGDEQINSFDSYWFAWYAYHPDTLVWRA